MKRRLNLEHDPKKLGKELGRIGIEPPLLDRIVENCGDGRWKKPPDWKVMKMLARREESLSETEKEFHALAKLAGWDRATVREIAEVLLPIYDISERPGYTTYGHQLRTMKHIRIILALTAGLKAERIMLDEEKWPVAMLGALFHDVGKAAVSYDLLCDPNRLPRLKKQMVKEHADHGARILLGIFSAFPVPKFGHIASTAYMHHERCDGAGYPEGITKSGIWLGARMAAFADTLDTKTSLRIYEDFPKTLEEALHEMRMDFESHFNSDVGSTFAYALDKLPWVKAETDRIIAEAGGEIP